MRHVISVKVENRAGVLARVAGLFSARGYNIDSLAVSQTEQEDVSVMTIVVRGDDRIIEQVKKQLNKLIDVIKVSDHSEYPSIQRELALVKVNAQPAKRSEVYQIAGIFRAEIVDISLKTVTLELTGEPERIDNFIELLRPYSIKELIRTGRISMSKE
ncbi:MAG TPA: acetolactate synthase small subunit [Spirochaetota bacterium]|nr:acetolactate synthase small subunit [Spirochaetota bacterium]OPZ37877.1 MAG: Acetolactate synthase small subunit [Spirochaetes bacterium ADurb.BinA120]HNU91183.1 acetolactate synthase small subunit [Spirochaetota bacterium]HPI14597.1 acetolactate synthase small subunit [Spirochaetota bacterium]HPO44891.1 acetolactate synthase small subunit [Spirochaetota bacterium]